MIELYMLCHFSKCVTFRYRVFPDTYASEITGIQVDVFMCYCIHAPSSGLRRDHGAAEWLEFGITMGQRKFALSPGRFSNICPCRRCQRTCNIR